MPPCPTCGDRQFASYEALKQHLDSSGVNHPTCVTCDRRFTSVNALEAHMAAKHPPTYDCVACQRSYKAPFALEDHYRGSGRHPNCGKCGKGFFDEAAKDEHKSVAHPLMACMPCGGLWVYEEDLELHYTEASKHPKCAFCQKGSKDENSLTGHLKTVHADRQCDPCGYLFKTPDESNAHFWHTPHHPKCQDCRLGFLNEDTKQEHFLACHAPTDASNPETEQITGTPTSTVVGSTQDDSISVVDSKLDVPASTGSASPTTVTSGISPITTATTTTTSSNTTLPASVAPPPPLLSTAPLGFAPKYAQLQQQQRQQDFSDLESTGFTPLTTFHPLHDFINRERKTHPNSPDLRLETGFTSPIKDVLPLASPGAPLAATLPRPGNGIEEVWNSKENVQITPTRDPRTFERTGQALLPPPPSSIMTRQQPATAGVWGSPVTTSSQRLNQSPPMRSSAGSMNDAVASTPARSFSPPGASQSSGQSQTFSPPLSQNHQLGGSSPKRATVPAFSLPTYSTFNDGAYPTFVPRRERTSAYFSQAGSFPGGGIGGGNQNGPDLRSRLYQGSIHQMRGGFANRGGGPAQPFSSTSTSMIPAYRNTTTGLRSDAISSLVPFVPRPSRFGGHLAAQGQHPLPPPSGPTPGHGINALSPHRHSVLPPPGPDVDWNAVIGERQFHHPRRRTEDERSEYSISVRSETRRGSGSGAFIGMGLGGGSNNGLSQVGGNGNMNQSLLSLTLPGSIPVTPVMNGRSVVALPQMNGIGSGGGDHQPSPSVGTSSSPTLSVMGHSPSSAMQETETRPTTASSTRTPSLKITYNGQQNSPTLRSPSVDSPTHLGALPAISPLITTPIDIPEATFPLPDSPPSIPSTALQTPDSAPTPTIPTDVPCSPATVVFEPQVLQPSLSMFGLEGDDENGNHGQSPLVPSPPARISPSTSLDLTLLPVEPMSTGSGLSPTPVDDSDRNGNGNGHHDFPAPRTELKAKEEEELLVDLSSPVSIFNEVVDAVLGGEDDDVLTQLSRPGVQLEDQADHDDVDDLLQGLSESPNDDVPHSIDAIDVAPVDMGLKTETNTVNIDNGFKEDNDVPVPSSAVTESSARNPLHCRDCLADTCDDITATMCGHIFCNRCIVQAVMKSSRCPVCSTPTLLYCLFRLDLAA